jgi:4-hydroxy-2-oxoheptanedioate aldolase
MHHAVHAVASCKVSPIVRVPSLDGWFIKRALDAGAHGVLLPLLRTAEDARKVVEACKFPPLGQRGFGSPFSMSTFDPTGALSGLAYMENANSHILTIVQIETKEALANVTSNLGPPCMMSPLADAIWQVDEIANVDGIDVLFIGPFDLGNNIGHPVRGEFDAELQEAILKIQNAAKKAEKKTGIYCPNGYVAQKYAEAGFHMVPIVPFPIIFEMLTDRFQISCINDMTVLPVGMADALSTAKRSKQEVRGAAYGGT